MMMIVWYAFVHRSIFPVSDLQARIAAHNSKAQAYNSQRHVLLTHLAEAMRSGGPTCVYLHRNNLVPCVFGLALAMRQTFI